MPVPVIDLTTPPTPDTPRLTEMEAPKNPVAAQQGGTDCADCGKQVALVTPPVKKAPVVVPAVILASACEKPSYPRNAQRNGESGTVKLALLVGSDGRVMESRVEKSSGVRELDQAARQGLRLCSSSRARLTGWRSKPGPIWNMRGCCRSKAGRSG